jgi:hypothetical protein
MREKNLSPLTTEENKGTKKTLPMVNGQHPKR